LRAFFSNFQGQKTFQIYLKNILASAFKNLIAYRWEKIESILFWVEIGYSHTIECVWERRTSMFPVLDTNLVLTKLWFDLYGPLKTTKIWSLELDLVDF
jgi:hypothetical protein